MVSASSSLWVAMQGLEMKARAVVVVGGELVLTEKQQNLRTWRRTWKLPAVVLFHCTGGIQGSESHAPAGSIERLLTAPNVHCIVTKSTGCSSREPGSVLSTYMAAHNHPYFSSRRSDSTLWPLPALHAHAKYPYMQKQINWICIDICICVYETAMATSRDLSNSEPERHVCGWLSG